MKGETRISCLTAYDFTSARLLDAAGIDIALVGDSLGMTMLGYDSTLPVTMDDMLHHSAAVARGVNEALVVADMPFLSYQVSVGQAVENAGRFLKESGADAVKIEGGVIRRSVVEALLANGIPVMGHIGLTPQSVKAFGGFKVQGKQPPEAEQLLKDAEALEQAGVFSIVLECVPAELAGEITRSVGVPTIGIGAGPQCDGQVLVMHDLLGLYTEFKPKFVKRYAELGTEYQSAFEAFKQEVRDGTFPTAEHSY
jgi:3-methyl-2-oxobutanoate hydroxymethyltransferase